jgi:PEP-CTERM motif
MRALLIAACLFMSTVAPAAASVINYCFTFDGAALVAPYDGLINSDKVTGNITFDTAYLITGFNTFNLGTINGDAAVPSLNVHVAYGGGGTADYTKNYFSTVIFDTSILGVDLTKELVGQNAGNEVNGPWGTLKGSSGSNPILSDTGDFEIFAVDPNVTAAAPNGQYPYLLATLGGTSNDSNYVQLTSFAPATVPEPTTYVLLTLALGVVGFARKRMGKQ